MPKKPVDSMAEVELLDRLIAVYARMVKESIKYREQQLHELSGIHIPVEKYIKPVRFGDYWMGEEERIRVLLLELENLRLKEKLKRGVVNV